MPTRQCCQRVDVDTLRYRCSQELSSRVDTAGGGGSIGFRLLAEAGEGMRVRVGRPPVEGCRPLAAGAGALAVHGVQSVQLVQQGRDDLHCTGNRW